LDADPVAREEEGRRELSALTLTHPVRSHTTSLTLGGGIVAIVADPAPAGSTASLPFHGVLRRETSQS
jgi:hypothetical protein